MPACRHFTSHAAHASDPWQEGVKGALDDMVRIYRPTGAVAAAGVPLRRWSTELQAAQELIPGTPGVLQQLQGKRTNTCMHALKIVVPHVIASGDSPHHPIRVKACIPNPDS